MTHITRYGRRLRLTLISGMSTACLVCLFAIPFAEKKLLKNEVGYYSVQLNGVEIGSANTRTDAEQALADARKKFSQEYETVVYMEDQIQIVEQPKLVSTRMTEDELASSIYSNLFACVTDKAQELAYTVRIDDFTVTLATKEEVVELMERVTSKYDTSNEFQVTLASSEGNGDYAIDVAKSEIRNTDTDIVAAAINGTAVARSEDGSVSRDGITGITFAEQVVVHETLAAGAQLVSVQDAYDAITKEKEEKTVYYVQAGDCLSVIANKNNLTLDELLALNEGMTEESLIVPGDAITVTVPVSELSVVITKQMTYEEAYNADAEYVDDDTAYRGDNKVISEGTTGRRRVTADITYVNGVQTEIEYLEQTILEPSQPQVISVGTRTAPTYIRPVSGGSVSSPYGYRWGTFHKGVDWSVSTGTTVKAAAAGTVTRAGWYADYGYCVDVRHPDGTMTRYGHLSAVEVSVGQQVSQGERIARSGNTGYSTGPHLHFEIWINGSTVNPLNYVNQ